MASTTPLSIAIVICSTRTPRVGPQIASYVHRTATTYLSTLPATTPPLTLTLLDLAAHPLPFLDEPLPPAHVTPVPDGYAHAHTRAWSAAVAAHAAFVFVTPQYNWGYPAGLKNALDFLFREWGGKPAGVVSYGGHGGGKAGAQLAQVLEGLRMRVVGRRVELMFPDREVMGRAAMGEEIGPLGGEGGVWEKEEEGVRELVGEVVRLLVEGEEEKKAA